MRRGIVLQLVCGIEDLVKNVEASPDELMAAISVLIVGNLESSNRNFLNVNAGNMELTINLNEIPHVKH